MCERRARREGFLKIPFPREGKEGILIGHESSGQVTPFIPRCKRITVSGLGDCASEEPRSSRMASGQVLGSNDVTRNVFLDDNATL